MTLTSLPAQVRIVEVGPRDGLQNEPEAIATADKVAFIEKLAEAGLTQIEATAFVHPRWVPQLADAADVLEQLSARPGVTYSALIPNMKGLTRAMESGVRQVNVVTAASDTFNRKNLNMSLAESLQVCRETIQAARVADLRVRAYVSTGFVCPYEGNIPPQAVCAVARALYEAGAQELSLGDTIGAAAPTDVAKTVGALLDSGIPGTALALHFHDTYGTALANVMQGLHMGITTFDSSAGGLGGCPYAPGASGNLATEDLVYLLDRMGIATGVNLAQLAETSLWLQARLGRLLPSKQLQRLAACKVDRKAS